MKTRCLTFNFALLIAWTAIPMIGIAQTPKETRLRVQLTDGGKLFGVTSTDSLQLQLEFSEIVIPLEKVRRIEWKPKSSTARVELENDDVLSGRLIAKTIPFQSLLGSFELRFEHLQSLERIPKEATGGLTTRKGLVAYYTFDHGLEGLGVDDASEKFRAEVKEATWIEQGKRGGAAEFSGAASLSIPHDDALNFAKGLTISAWVHPTGHQSGYAMIVGKTVGSSWNGGYGLVRMSGDPENVYFFVNNYSGNYVKAPLKSEAWSHVVCVCDGKKLAIYINGKESQSAEFASYYSATSTIPGAEGPILPVEQPLMLGSDMSSYFWKGKLDEVALFERPLSEQEVLSLYESTAQEWAVKSEPASLPAASLTPLAR